MEYEDLEYLIKKKPEEKLMSEEVMTQDPALMGDINDTVEADNASQGPEVDTATINQVAELANTLDGRSVPGADETVLPPPVAPTPLTPQQAIMAEYEASKAALGDQTNRAQMMDAFKQMNRSLAGQAGNKITAGPTSMSQLPKETSMAELMAKYKMLSGGEDRKLKEKEIEAKNKIELAKMFSKKSEDEAKAKGKKTKFQETREKNIANRFDELHKQQTEIKSNIGEAKTLLKLIEDDKLDTGFGSETAGKFGSVISTKESGYKERLDSLAERAARAQLKANGEVRPTDADVEGMKKAMFNIGNTEATNITKLQEFIKVQEAGVDEYNQMKKVIGEGKNAEHFISENSYKDSGPVNVKEKVKEQAQTHPKKSEAEKWALSNPDNPKAQEILKALGK